MPCRCDGDPNPLDGYLTTDPKEREKLLSDMFYHAHDQRNHLTALLCDFVQCFIKHRKIPTEIYEWSKEHCSFDEKHGRAWPLTLDDLPVENIDFDRPKVIAYRPMKEFKRKYEL